MWMQTIHMKILFSLKNSKINFRMLSATNCLNHLKSKTKKKKKWHTYARNETNYIIIIFSNHALSYFFIYFLFYLFYLFSHFFSCTCLDEEL